MHPPRIDGDGDLCETHRLKQIHRAVQDHAYLTLLDWLRARAVPGTQAAASAQSALSWVDRLIWRLPEGGGMGTDHPYQRDARELERARREIADAISAFGAGLHSEPETHWKPTIGPQIPAGATAQQAGFGASPAATAIQVSPAADPGEKLASSVTHSEFASDAGQLVLLPGTVGNVTEK